VADEFALEELRQAAEALATSSGRMQERLADAATFLMRVRREDISDEPLGRNLVSVLMTSAMFKRQATRVASSQH
jgi:hypothetical protein